MKRSRLDIIHDIISAVADKQGGIKPTHLLYKSNLSHKALEAYLNDLIAKGLIEESYIKKSKTFSITDKGLDFIAKYKGFSEFIDSFGLQE